MRTFAVTGCDVQHPTGTFLLCRDEYGRSHVLRVDEQAMHVRAHSCSCMPRTVINSRGTPVITHRRIRNSRTLFQPWERGH